MKTITIITIFFLISSCAVVPKFSEDSDNARCNLATKKMSLDIVGAKGGNLNGVKGEGAAVVAIAAAGVFAISGIISTSIVIAGNTVHWIEKQGKCDDSFIQTYVVNHNEPLLENNGQLVIHEE